MSTHAEDERHGATAHERVEDALEEVIPRVSNWGRWGEDDVLGTLNFIDAAKRAAAGALVRRGEAISLGLEFGRGGPQNGFLGRFNPVHTMTHTIDSKVRGRLPHGFGVADDMVVLPSQCATHWDGLGHIYDRARAWNGRDSHDVATVDGDSVTGIEKVAHAFVSRAVLLDVGRACGEGELADGAAITVEHLSETIAKQGPSAVVGRGDIVLLRTGQMSRARREGWGNYAGGPAPGLSFGTIDWIHETEIAAVASDTWGVEVRPNEFADAYQPFHQVVIPHIGLYLGEMFDLDQLAARCAQDGSYECLLVAAPLPISGGIAGPVNPIALR